MYEEDYIKRLIKQFSQVLTYILGLVEDQNYPDALLMIENTLQDFLGINPTLVYHLSANDIVNLLSLDGSTDAGRLFILAELLKVEGEIYTAKNDPEGSTMRYLKSLELFLEIAETTGLTEDIEEGSAIEFLVSQLEPVGIPNKLMQALTRYYELDGEN
jgi:hypothetical protein